MECIFCKIIAGEIPAEIVHRDDAVVAIKDLNPQAPVHLLVMPVTHSANIGDFVELQPQNTERLFGVAARLGAQHGAGGFRLVVNMGAQGGQTVDHLHVHVLAGRQMHWPPG